MYKIQTYCSPDPILTVYCMTCCGVYRRQVQQQLLTQLPSVNTTKSTYKSLVAAESTTHKNVLRVTSFMVTGLKLAMYSVMMIMLP